MATSGTYTFTVTRDDVINAAFRSMQTYGAADAGPSVADIADAAQALELIMKTMAIEGLPLWCVVTTTVPMVANTATYSLGSPRPLRILDAYLRDTNNNDVNVQIMSRYDYDNLGQKSSTGVVTQLWYDPQIGDGSTAPPGAGVITVYDVPATTSSYTLYLVIQRSIQDAGISTNNLDFPQEAYLMLKWALAEELCLEYEVPKDVRAEIKGKALYLREQFFASCQEQASVYFTPSERTR